MMVTWCRHCRSWTPVRFWRHKDKRCSWCAQVKNVGPNPSGKEYARHQLWGLQESARTMRTRQVMENEPISLVDGWPAATKSPPGTRIAVSQAELEERLAWELQHDPDTKLADKKLRRWEE